MVSMAVAVLLLLMFEGSRGIVHKVGESDGWTIIGNVDYKKWALSKSFQIGDTIVFEYNPQFHNVMQVTHAEYRSCNASTPITTRTTGNDSVLIDTPGHHFFICGVPGHCQAGQRVDINVLRAPSVAASPSGFASPAPVVLTMPTPPPTGDAPEVAFGKLAWLLVVLQIVCVFGLV